MGGPLINATLLSNCTKSTIDKYQWVTDINSSFIDFMNQTEVLDLIAIILDTEKQQTPSSAGSIR